MLGEDLEEDAGREPRGDLRRPEHALPVHLPALLQHRVGHKEGPGHLQGFGQRGFVLQNQRLRSNGAVRRRLRKGLERGPGTRKVGLERRQADGFGHAPAVMSVAGCLLEDHRQRSRQSHGSKENLGLGPRLERNSRGSRDQLDGMGRLVPA